MHNMRGLGANVRYLIQRKNFSIDEISKQIDIDYFDFLCFLEGYIFLSFTQLENLAKILEVNVDDMLNCSPRIYNRYVFNNKMKSEEEVDKADAILDRVEALIHDIHCKDLEEIKILKARLLNLERKLKEYESNATKSE